MLFYEHGNFAISRLKVHYIDEQENEVIKYVGQEGREWWVDFAEKWKDTFELKGFEEVEVTQEQLDRLDSVNSMNIPNGTTLVEEYVTKGDLSKVLPTHPLAPIKYQHTLEDVIRNISAINTSLEVYDEALFEVIMEMYSE